MEQANSLLTLICSVITIVSAIVVCFVFFYNKLSDSIKEVGDDSKKQFDKLSDSVVNIEKDMLKSSDDRLKRLIIKVNRRVEDVDEEYLKKHREAKTDIEEMRTKLDEAKKLILNLNKRPHPDQGDTHEKVEWLTVRDIENRSVIISMNKKIKSHDEWIAELRRKK